jgi:hypothetical protein
MERSATLAYDCRRPEFFTERLYATLRLIDRGVLSPGSLRSPLIDGTEGVYGTPVLPASSGVTCEEVAPWEENGQKWRVLRATFNETIDNHCAVQKFYFDDKGMLQRHDYFTNVAKGNAAHYCID